ncbi:hypothetical protein HK100_009963 [Physocladia obscura]|uniref:cAMP-dependent protein kinase n=1 Tax=Physocladia obscura TaxID=109957 RepID=A0AAD5T2U2_9FUNG|nr:hypothetical protein HK100_009963 [Physocladia obscura]
MLNLKKPGTAMKENNVISSSLLPPVNNNTLRNSTSKKSSNALYDSKIQSAAPKITVSGGSRCPSSRSSTIARDPSILQNEINTLNNAAKKLGGNSAAKTVSSSKLTVAQKLGVKNKSNQKINTGPSKGSLDVPGLGVTAKRPTSAPHNTEGSQMEEAQINAAFLGNNLRVKKHLKDSVANGQLKSSDFDIKEQIGKGAFARVHVIKFKEQKYEECANMTASQLGRTYAIKSLRKADIVKTKQIKHVMSEKNILAMLKSPFIVELVTTFQDQKHLYLVLEYIPGGDMFSHIRKHVRFQEHVARFYTVEILLALEYIHSKDVIYRDLKPENILIDLHGHVKIADFGFAKVVPRNHAVGRVTFCGTPAYMAPEIILKTGYSKAADWWSLGTVCYELMAGYSPFQAESPLRIYERILNYDLRWSSQIQDVGRDLLGKILESQPNKRLGMNGAKEIKAHPWFRSVNWKDAESLMVPVPFVPSVDGDGDIRNFDIYTDQSSVITMQNGTITLTSEDNVYDGMFPDF